MPRYYVTYIYTDPKQREHHCGLFINRDQEIETSNDVNGLQEEVARVHGISQQDIVVWDWKRIN